MGILRRDKIYGGLVLGLVLGLGGCIFASMRNEAPQTTSLTSARMQASTAAPSLPILVARTARDDIGLTDAERANVSMIVDTAELDARTLDRARAALLEGLARGVDANDFDDTLLALLTEQMSWAAAEVAPRLQRAMDQLHDVLTPEQRLALVERVSAKLPSWAPVWAAEPRHRWLDTWAEGELGREPLSRDLGPARPELSDDLVRTSRTWAEKSVANVRAKLPHLDPAQRRALAASLRTGLPE